MRLLRGRAALPTRSPAGDRGSGILRRDLKLDHNQRPWQTHPTSGRQVNFGVNLTGIGAGRHLRLDVHDIAPDGSSARSLRIPLRSFPFSMTSL